MNFRKTVWATMIAVPTLFTACSEPEVSDEVTQLRQTQADLLAQRVEAQRLENALQEIDNAREQLDLDIKTAESAAQFAQAEADLETANLNLQTAIDALADYLFSEGLEDAAKHLENYGDAQDDANNTLGQIIDQEVNLANMQLIYDADNPEGEGKISYALAAEIIQRDLDDLRAEQTALEAALVSLEGVETDPGTAQSEINDLTTEVQDLENKNLALMVALEKATQAANAAADALDDANETIGEYETSAEEVTTAQDEITAKQDEIDAKQDELLPLEALLNEQNVSLAVRQQVLNDAEAALAPYLAAISAAEADVEAAENAEYAAQAAYDIVNNDFGNNNATQAELDAAQAVLTAAQTALADAQQALADAGDDAVGPQNLYNIALGNRDTEQGKVDDTTQDIANANSDLIDLQSELAELEEILADEQADVAELQSAYDSAIAGLEQLEIDADTTKDVTSAIQDEYDANDDMADNLQDVIDVLENQLDGINDAINDLRDDIEDKKAEVEAKEKILADNSISETEWEREIAREQAELAKLNEEYNAHLALAQAYLDAYNAAIAALG